MPRNFVIAFGFFLTATTTPCLAQGGKAGAGTINTIGTATVKFQPDSVRITFGHQAKVATLKDVRGDSDRQVGRIKDALKALKIDGMIMETSTSSVQVLMSNNPAGGIGGPVVPDMPLTPTGYQVTTSFTVTAKAKDLEALRDIAKRVGDTAIDNGANISTSPNVNYNGPVFIGGIGGGAAMRNFAPGIEIFRADLTEAHQKALKDAVKNALMKADTLAQGAGGKIKGIVSISDELSPLDGIGPSTRMPGGGGLAGLMFGMPQADPPTLTSTSLTLRVRVTCSFE